MNTPPPVAKVHFKGASWSLVPGGNSTSYFGGPHTDHVESRIALDEAVLHHVATVNLPRFGVGNPRFGFSVPLFYGICHEGCEIEYRKTATSAVEITSLDPAEAEEGYPYHAYPPLLPYHPLEVVESHPCKHAELCERFGNTGWDLREDCLYVGVMQHPSIGHSIFEPGSDVEIVFEYDPETGVVRGTSQCS